MTDRLRRRMKVEAWLVEWMRHHEVNVYDHQPNAADTLSQGRVNLHELADAIESEIEKVLAS